MAFPVGRGWHTRSRIGHLALVVGLLLSLLSSPTQAQIGDGRPPFRYGIIVNDSSNYSEAAKLGFGYVKVYVSWRDIESSPGSFGGYPDNAVQRALGNNLRVVALVYNAPAWAADPGADTSKSAPPSAAHLGDFATFMTHLAAHYKGQIAAYEIWNEENVSDSWGGENPDASRFVSMLQAASASIRAADQHALVISGGVANTFNGNGSNAISDLVYLQDILQLGAANDVDAIGIHPYPGNCPPTATSCGSLPAFGRAADEHNVVAQYGGAALPLWITEFGYFSAPGAIDPNAGGCNGGNGLGGFTAYEVDETTKANDLVASFQYAYNNWPWLGMAMVMNLDFAMDPYRQQCDPVRFWSILTSAGRETPAYAALMNMTKETPRIIVNPSPSYAQAAGTVVVSGSAVDPTSGNGTTVQAVLASLDAPWTNPNQSLPATAGPGAAFTVVVDVTHLAVQSFPHVVYVYVLTTSSGWVDGGQGLTVEPEMNVTPETLSFAIDPANGTNANATLTLGRNDSNPSPFGWNSSTAGGGWLHLARTSDWTVSATVNAGGLSNGTYQATITIAADSGSPSYFKDSPLVVPVTLKVGPADPPPPRLPARVVLPAVFNEMPIGGF